MLLVNEDADEKFETLAPDDKTQFSRGRSRARRLFSAAKSSFQVFGGGGVPPPLSDPKDLQKSGAGAFFRERRPPGTHRNPAKIRAPTFGFYDPSRALPRARRIRRRSATIANGIANKGSSRSAAHAGYANRAFDPAAARGPAAASPSFFLALSLQKVFAFIARRFDVPRPPSPGWLVINWVNYAHSLD